VQVAGTISAIEKKFTKKDGKPFAIVCLEDFSGQVEVMVWGETYAKAARHIEKGKIVAVSAKLDRREESARLVANDVGPITRGRPVAAALTIDIPYEKADEARLMALRHLIQQFPGTQPLFLRIHRLDGQELRLKADAGFAVRDDASFREKVAELLA
jgi:DNA polymerase III subunit alpha